MNVGIKGGAVFIGMGIGICDASEVEEEGGIIGGGLVKFIDGGG